MTQELFITLTPAELKAVMIRSFFAGNLYERGHQRTALLMSNIGRGLCAEASGRADANMVLHGDCGDGYDSDAINQIFENCRNEIQDLCGKYGMETFLS
jgi:hypothetical protein